LEDFADSVPDFDRAIQLNSVFGETYSGRAFAKLNMKDYPGAIADYDTAIAITPSGGINYAYRGIARRTLGQRDAAIQDFRDALLLGRIQNNSALVAATQQFLRNLGVNE
jgi:tetratricopeptide (TPR) repeat protein